jgi:glycosyltransferase involved in cell wall biosynthesis
MSKTGVILVINYGFCNIYWQLIMIMYKQKQTVLYLRVDLGGKQLAAGGSVAHTRGVINGFLSNNWSVVCASSAMHELLRAEDIPFFPLSMPCWLRPLRWKINSLLSNIFFTWHSIRACSRESITCVYQRHAPWSLVGVLVAWWLKVPLILEYNGSEVWMARHWQVKTNVWHSLVTFGWLLRFLENRALRSASYLVVVSQASSQQLQKAGIAADNIIVRPNGVDTAVFDPCTLADYRLSLRERYGFDKRFVFGFIGTFSPWHGIDQLARMIPPVVTQQGNAAFLLLGDGQLKQWLQDRLREQNVPAERVVFTGIVPQQQAPHYLAACDAFLLPTQPNEDGSPFFGSPIKLFEYMSMAKPIIASDIAQVAHVLAGIGILVKPTDTQGFIDAAHTLITSPLQELERRGAMARSYVVKQCTWHEHVKEIIAVIQDIVPLPERL